MVFMGLISVKNISKCILRREVFTQFRQKTTDISINKGGILSHVKKVVTTNDNTTFVAWHPTNVFQYQHSIPLSSHSIQNITLLEDDAIQTAMQAFGNKRPEIAQQELMKLTNTSKHTWKPRQRDRKAKKTPMDREYL